MRQTGTCLSCISIPGTRHGVSAQEIFGCPPGKGVGVALCSSPAPDSLAHFLEIKSILLNIVYEAPCVCFLLYSQGSDFDWAGDGEPKLYSSV